jgi:cell division protein FtsX
LEQAENFEIYQQLKQRDNIPQNEYLSEEEFLKHLQNS